MGWPRLPVRPPKRPPVAPPPPPAPLKPGQLSAHFFRGEFACHHCGRLPAGLPARELVRLLERIRTQYAPEGLTVVSGYRCPTHNTRVGGAADSRHLHGDAADIPAVMHLADALNLGATGVGVSMMGQHDLPEVIPQALAQVRGKVVHVDTRPGPATAWAYTDDGQRPIALRRR